MLLAALTVTAGQARADVTYGQLIYDYSTDGSDGGELAFYASAEDANAQSMGIETVSGQSSPGHDVCNLSGRTLTDNKVYILARPAFGHTGLGVNFTVEKSGDSNIAQARRRTADATDIPFGNIPVTPVDGMLGIYCFEMPADPNITVTITAKFEALPTNADAITYVDADGTTKTKPAGTVYVLDGTDFRLGKYTASGESATDPDTGKPYETWYVCNDDLAYPHGLRLYGDVHLILTDGKTMNVTQSTYNSSAPIYGSTSTSLTIYGQSLGTGTLSATTIDDNKFAIQPTPSSSTVAKSRPNTGTM